jgi:FdhD protein
VKSSSEGIGAGSIVRRKADGSFECITDEVAIEEPLEIRIDGRSLAITMRTPGHDEELAAGFLLSEGVIQSRADLRDVRQAAPNVIEVSANVQIDSGSMQRFGTISSSCGLCGKTNIDAIRQHFPPIESRVKIKAERLLAMPAQLRTAQGNFDRTGGLHAAALFGLTSDQMVLREDVGRHNAVDKVTGRALFDDLIPLHDHALMVSGRASLEIVQKALAAGVAIVASVSAPSSLAINFARETGITLVGFLRPPTFNVYSHVERLDP